MSPQRAVAVLAFLAILAPSLVAAQTSLPKNGYYVGLGDSVAAGEGASPVTAGYVYDLYHGGVFGRMQEMHFANAALRGARSWELRSHQVSQVLCVNTTQRPTVVTITAGANDFLKGDQDIVSIAWRVADSVNVLLNNNRGPVASPVLDPVTQAPCRALDHVTILVSNYYSIPHPVPQVFALLDTALQGFDQALRFWLQFVPVPPGSKVAVVDLYTPSLGRSGLVHRTVNPEDPFNFDVHPTNVGHAFIAKQFEDAWRSVN